MDFPVQLLNLSVRARDVLASTWLNVQTIGQLVRLTDEELLGAPSMGKTTVREIKQLLESLGLRLGMTDADCIAVDLTTLDAGQERRVWEATMVALPAIIATHMHDPLMPYNSKHIANLAAEIGRETAACYRAGLVADHAEPEAVKQ